MYIISIVPSFHNVNITLISFLLARNKTSMSMFINIGEVVSSFRAWSTAEVSEQGFHFIKGRHPSGLAPAVLFFKRYMSASQRARNLAITSKFLFSHLILYMYFMQWTSVKKFFDLDRKRFFLWIFKNLKILFSCSQPMPLITALTCSVLRVVT